MCQVMGICRCGAGKPNVLRAAVKSAGCLRCLLCMTFVIGIIPHADTNNECCEVKHDVIFDCKRCNLQRFPPVPSTVNATDITKLYLTDNSIKHTLNGYFVGFDSLEKLHLDQNELTCLVNGTFLGASSLDKLDLSSNRLFAIQEDAFNDLSALTILHLQNNLLEYLPDGIFSTLTKLEKLELQSNKLHDRSLPMNLLKNMKSLHTFDMSNNQLTTIASDFFKDLVNLIRVSLKDNMLTAVNMQQWPSSVVRVLLSGNQVINITNVPDSVEHLSAQQDDIQCTCENKKALELILHDVAGTGSVAEKCPNLNSTNCNTSANSNSSSYQTRGDRSAQVFGLGTTAASSGPRLISTCWSSTLHLAAVILTCTIKLCHISGLL